MPRRLADLIGRVERAYQIPRSQAIELASRLTFTIALDNLTDAEASDLFSNRPSVGMGEIGAAGGNLPHVQLAVPERAGVVSIVRGVLLSSNTAQSVDLNTGGAALATLSTSVGFSDRRMTGLPATEVRTEARALLGNTIGRVTALGTGFEFIPLDFILGENARISLVGRTADTSIAVTWFWTEEDA